MLDTGVFSGIGLLFITGFQWLVDLFEPFEIILFDLESFSQRALPFQRSLLDFTNIIHFTFGKGKRNS
jgi:hypothetical protein